MALFAILGVVARALTASAAILRVRSLLRVFHVVDARLLVVCISRIFHIFSFLKGR